MAISMRHTKMKAEEVALIAGEIKKPTWESRNEGIHERVSFEDTIWGFDLAGGSYYKTPLRVTFVKAGSRAEMANVKPGDLLLRINDIDTSTLTIQEAHKLIVESGINIKLHVTGPEDIQDSFFYYEDPPVDDTPIEDLKIIEERLRRQREYNLKSALHLKLQWPWVSKKFLVYRESNCFMVPSKYESTRRDKYPELPSVRLQDVIVFDKTYDDIPAKKELNDKKQNSTEDKEEVSLSEEEEEDAEESNADEDQLIDGHEDLSSTTDVDNNELEEINDENSIATVEEQQINDSKDKSDLNNHLGEETENLVHSTDKIPEEANKKEYAIADNGIIPVKNTQMNDAGDKISEELTNNDNKDNEMINELLKDGDTTPKAEEDKIINGVLNSDDQSHSRHSENER